VAGRRLCGHRLCENASDAGDYRPGAQAAAEFQVAAPLKEAGLDQGGDPRVFRPAWFADADKPQDGLLELRIPHGEPVTPEKSGYRGWRNMCCAALDSMTCG